MMMNEELTRLRAELKSMGAPGDYGYGTDIGKALMLAHRIMAVCHTQTARADRAEADRAAIRAENAKMAELVETLLGVLKRISAPQYGLQGLMEDNAKEEDFTKYWCNMASGFASMARAAIAEYQKWKDGK